jgi:hypothetical protein
LTVARSPYEELRHLADVYALTMDDRDAETLIGLFAPEGVLTIASEQTREFAAPEGLVQIIGYMSRYAETMYFVGNHVCEIDGDRASGETYSMAYHRRDGQLIVNAIRYLDEYVRLADGWRFQRRDARILWTEARELST